MPFNVSFLFATQHSSYLYVFVVPKEFTEERLFFFVCSRVSNFLDYRQGGTFDFLLLLLSFVHLDVILALLSDPS